MERLDSADSDLEEIELETRRLTSEEATSLSPEGAPSSMEGTPQKTKKKFRDRFRPSALYKAAKKGVKSVLKKDNGSKRAPTGPLTRAATMVGQSTERQHREFQEDLESRTIELSHGNENPGFTENSIRTSKYNVVTFLPRFLFEMFSRAAYLYFLVQAVLSWWSVVSPFGGTGSTAALLFVLLVAAGKAIVEDYKRHVEDSNTNASKTRKVLADGKTVQIKWKDVKVGHVLEVKDNELFPADLLCLHSSLPDKVCFIRTTNLDGESNLKIRRPLDVKGASVPSPFSSGLDLKGRLQCEKPNPNLHLFNGRFTTDEGGAEKKMPVTMNEVLLRGCMLKNTGHIWGLVVYTGEDTRIQMNSVKTPLKIGSFDRFLNIQIGLVILLQVVMCLFSAAVSVAWRDLVGDDRYHLAMTSYEQGNYENGFVYFCIVFITFWILYAYLVPISLFVTMEIVKFWQGFLYINNDPLMDDGTETGGHAKARNSNLNEDLGKVEYVFSDKTGTLTSNEMQLRMIAIKGVAYGSMDFKLEDHKQMEAAATLKRWDKHLMDAVDALNDEDWRVALDNCGSEAAVLALPNSQPDTQVVQNLMGAEELTNGDLGEASDAADVVLGQHLLDFWLNICICQSLIVEKPAGGGIVYQGPSPDEVALLDGGRQLGFEFVARSTSAITLRMVGTEVKYEILNVLEYSSDRGRMSVIARGPDGSIRLFCKGADSKVLAVVRKSTDRRLLEETNKNLHHFATQGLRTLAVASKDLTEEQWSAWDERYQEAAGQLQGRDEALAALGNEIETDLELVGVTAIEDKLQDGVPQAIQSLLSAGLKVWVITGDKQETAINIAISCKLIRNPDSLLICNAHTPETAKERLTQLLKENLKDVQPRSSKRDKKVVQLTGQAVPGELVIDGPTLSHILGVKESEALLADVGSRCRSVVICRASPSQKAAIVTLMTRYELQKAKGNSTGMYRWYLGQVRRGEGKMLAIGDGANDVAMIQAADIGVGIMGKEGRQAVNNSDYAIAQFRFLNRLLMVHGTLCSYRLGRLIKYSFYKNVAFAFILFFYQFYSGFSGQALVDDISAAMYNVVFTSVPILLFAVMDRPVRNFQTLEKYPQVYNKHSTLTTWAFWKNGVIMATVDAAISFFIPYYAITCSGTYTIADVYSVGKVVFISLLAVVNLEVGLVSRYWTTIFAIFLFLSYALVYPFTIVFPFGEIAIGTFDPAQFGSIYIFGSGYFWFVQLVVIVACFGHRLVERSIVWLFKPQDMMVLEEVELKQSKTGERAPMSEADVEAAPAAEIQRQPLRNKFNSTDTPHA